MRKTNSEIAEYVYELHENMEDTNLWCRIMQYEYYELEELKLDDIDAERFWFEEDIVDEYSKLKSEAPPIICYYDNECDNYGIIDGVHRYEAKKLKFENLPYDSEKEVISAWVGKPETVNFDNECENDDEEYDDEEYDDGAFESRIVNFSKFNKSR